MNDRIVLNEVRGTIIKVYEYSVVNGKNTTSMEKGIIIQPDDSKEGTISEAYIGRDYSQFSVGQRVVHVSYTWKRPANAYDKAKYSYFGRKCPNEIDEFEYITYDELSYDQKNQSAKSR